MNDIKLTQIQEREYQAVRHFVVGHRNIRRLTAELSISARTAQRYIVGYSTVGRSYFAHGNCGKISPRRTSDEIRQTVVELYNGKYSGATYVHFTELLALNENINLSNSFVRKLLRSKFLLSPMATKRTKRDARRELRRLQETAPPNEQEELAARILNLGEAHPARPRKRYFGELLQTDASEHAWFGAEKAALHIAVDDATSHIVGAYFDTHETLNGYFYMSEQFLTDYGIPVTILADNRTVFIYNSKKPSDDDRKTQYGYMCKNLGIEIRTTSVAQAKGRVERMWETLQNRLPLELRLAGIKTIEDANAFLAAYIPRFNEKFALPLETVKSVFIPAPPPEELSLILSVVTERKIDNGSSLRYDNKLYATLDRRGDRVFLASRTKGIVAKTLDGALFFTAADITYALEPIPTHEPYSANFDPTPLQRPTPKINIPAKNHVWRLLSIKNFRDKIKNA